MMSASGKAISEARARSAKGRRLLAIAFSSVALIAAVFGIYEYLNGERYDLKLVYTGKLSGELEPCGCAEESNLGGIKRQATLITRLRSQSSHLVLLSAGGLFANNSWQDKVKGKYILQAMQLLGYDSVGAQWSDLAFGVDFNKAYEVPWTNSNSVIGQGVFSRSLARGPWVMEHFTWLDPDDARVEDSNDVRQHLIDASPRLVAAMNAAKSRGSITILTTTVPADKLLKHLNSPAVDILMTASDDEKYSEPTWMGRTLVLRYGVRGMNIASLDLALDASNHIRSYRQHIYKLSTSVPDSPRMEDWYAQYNSEVKGIYQKLAAYRKSVASGSSDFLGAKACVSCHKGQFDVWAASKHAAAFRSLESVNKQYDPECIQCHTVGFNKSGGFVDQSVSGALINVQCESCHGPSREHVQSMGVTKTTNAGWKPGQMCQQCHVGNHSPVFSFDKYWSRIVH
jgi:hypothetical protein